MSPLFERDREALRADQLEQLQLERLQALLARLRRNVRRYRELLGDARVESLADLGRLPATTPENLVEAFPYGMFALPLREVIRLHSTVGPDGRQIVVGHTRNDLDQWGRLVARQLVAAGVTGNDVLQICFGGGFFGQALGYMRGAEVAGACVIPEDPFHVEYQLDLMKNYRATVLITTPSNARDLVEVIRARRMDPQALELRALVLSRPVGPEVREELETGLFARAFCGFGLPEILDPGLAVECPEHNLHVSEDHFLVETVAGELVVTTLAREAMPLLRYRTRVAAQLECVKCPCGRTGVVLRPGGRLDDRMTVNEVPLYRAQVEQFLAQTRIGRQPFALSVAGRTLELAVEVSEDIVGDKMGLLTDLKAVLESEFQARFGIVADLRFTSPSRKPA
ncbi:MAG: Phenylacetate-coenzyme A ligase [Lentisphaerae bacterium ADurb.BinA184]|nr:MAG: Phenylacetate-coenzyme A ligase [Lentisphaerae bacterium ADurb.BinA184]